MKVNEAERAIREALREGGEKFEALGLVSEGYVLFSDAKYIQCDPEASRYLTAVLAIKLPSEETHDIGISGELDESDEDSATDEIPLEDENAEEVNDGEEDGSDEDYLADEDEPEECVYEIDLTLEVKNGEINDSDVESAILTFLEDCDDVVAKLDGEDDLGAVLDELRKADEAQYMELLGKLKKLRIGFFVAAGIMAIIIILAIIL